MIAKCNNIFNEGIFELMFLMSTIEICNYESNFILLKMVNHQKKSCITKSKQFYET